MNIQLNIRLLLTVFFFISQIQTGLAHHGGGSVGSGNNTNSDTYELPIIIGLDGSIVLGYGAAAGEFNETGLSPFQVTPVLNLGYLYQDKKIQLEDGRYLRFRSNNSNIGYGGILTYSSSYLFGTVAQFGLLRNKSVMSSMLQTSSGKVALDQLSPLEIPKGQDGLSRWNKGDQLSFSTTGSIVFATGLGVWPMGLNGQIIASGTWLINLTKTGENKVRLLMRRDSSRGIGFAAGAIVLELGKNISKSFDQDFSYEFDLSNESAKIAYLKALTGDWVYVSNLWRKKTTGVRKVSVGNGSSHTGRGIRRYGVPYFYRVNQSLTSTTRNANRNFFDENSGQSTDKEKSVIATIDQVRTKIKRSRQIYKIQYLFKGGIDNHMHGDVNHRHPVASFKWFSERRYTSLVNFEYFLDMVAKVSGFNELLDIELPNVSSGYARISVDFNINGKGFKKLFNTDHLRANDTYLDKFILKLKSSYNNKEDQYFRDTIKKMGHYLLNKPSALQEFANIVTRDGYSLKVKVEGENFLPIKIAL